MFSTLRRTSVACAILIAASLHAPVVRAGIPVIDAANLVQAMQQVASWARQYTQMVEQLQTLSNHYNAVTGVRNLGGIFNNPMLRELLPNDLTTIYDNVNGGTLSLAAQALRNAQRIYDCQGLDGADQTRCRASLNLVAESQSQLRSAYQRVVQRTDQIESLREQINTTEDPKAISELQARLQAETAQVGNDQNKIQSMISMHAFQREHAEQARHEAAMLNLQSPNDGVTGLAEEVRQRWAAVRGF